MIDCITATETCTSWGSSILVLVVVAVVVVTIVTVTVGVVMAVTVLVSVIEWSGSDINSASSSDRCSLGFGCSFSIGDSVSDINC